MFAQITEKIELTFWDVCIAFLSKAAWLKWPIAVIMLIRQDGTLKNKCLIAGMVACAGFSFGIIIYFLTQLF